MTCVLIGCGKTKLSRPCLARELYIGSVTRARIDYAEREATSWRILSAHYGLLRPVAPVAPYERTVRDLRREGLEGAWAREAARRVDAWLELAGTREVEVHLGEDYARELLVELHALGIRATFPVRGLSTGALLAWYRGRRMMGGVP
jgi:hypothetical protein